MPQGAGFISCLAGFSQSDGVRLSLKLAQVEEKLTHARQQLGVLEAKGHDPHVQQRLLAHLSAQAEVLRADRATCQSTLQQASQAVHPFTLAESQAQSSAQVESQLQQAVATLNTLHAAHTARDHGAAVRKSPRQTPTLAASVDAWWLGVEHQVTPLALDEPTQSGFQQQLLLPVVYWQAQVEKTKTPALKTAYQQAFRRGHMQPLKFPLRPQARLIEARPRRLPPLRLDHRRGGGDGDRAH
jgi:hypothetical protein